MTQISLKMRSKSELCTVQKHLGPEKLKHDQNGNKSPIKWLPKNGQKCSTLARLLCVKKTVYHLSIYPPQSHSGDRNQNLWEEVLKNVCMLRKLIQRDSYAKLPISPKDTTQLLNR